MTAETQAPDPGSVRATGLPADAEPMRSRPERFKPNDGGTWIDDDDFGFDAMLKVDGDFGSDADRLAYAQFICDKLNAPEAIPAPDPGDPLPCPFCGCADGLSFEDGSTHRWGLASCVGCGATAGEVRRHYPDDGAWHAEAVRQWNTRAAIPAPEGAQARRPLEPTPEMVAAARAVFGANVEDTDEDYTRIIRAALAAPAPQAAPLAWLMTADDDGSADWVELGAVRPASEVGFRAVPLGPLAAPQAVPELTKAQVDAIWESPTPQGTGKSRYDLARELIAAARSAPQAPACAHAPEPELAESLLLLSLGVAYDGGTLNDGRFAFPNKDRFLTAANAIFEAGAASAAQAPAVKEPTNDR